MEGLGRVIDRTFYLRHDIYRSRSVVSKESLSFLSVSMNNPVTLGMRTRYECWNW